jgi:hypothetical protein
MSSTASRAHYARIRSKEGKALRDFFNQALTDADRLPGRKALQQMAEELGQEIGASPKGLAEQFVKYAQQAQRVDGHAGSRFRLRGQIDQLAGALVQKLADEDRIIPVEENTDADIEAAVEQASTSATPDWDRQDRERDVALDAAENRQAEMQRAARSAR